MRSALGTGRLRLANYYYLVRWSMRTVPSPRKKTSASAPNGIASNTIGGDWISMAQQASADNCLAFYISRHLLTIQFLSLNRPVYRQVSHCAFMRSAFDSLLQSQFEVVKTHLKMYLALMTFFYAVQSIDIDTTNRHYYIYLWSSHVLKAQM